MITDVILLNDDTYQGAELEAFEKKYLEVMKNIADASVQKKRLEEQEKKLKSQLQKVMDDYDIKSIENQYLKITRVSANKGTVTIDTSALQKAEPELFNELCTDYPKLSGAKKSYIMFKVKG